MNFFEQQDLARRNTRLLVGLFALAVIGMILVFYTVSLTFINDGSQWWNPEALFSVAIMTLAVIGLGTGYKLLQINSGGGAAVAESLGGRLIQPTASGVAERRLLNVVEEMALASGVPTPSVYLLNEEGINAFAAGRSPEEAVIGVTRGTMERLTREQLQGVIAHEFSHILNGDMALNMRLMGVLHGILIVSLLGQLLVRSMAYRAAFRGSRSRKGDPGLALLIFGIVLMGVGWVGVLFGSMIKAAISRQREYLADASAVQFTRNPDGISGALKAIGAHQKHAILDAPSASEASHLFFATGVSSLFGSPFATHPPLDQRIKRLDQQWDGKYGPPPPPAKMQRRPPPPLPDAVRGTLNLEPGIMQIAIAAELLQGLPQSLREGVREVVGARAFIYALLLSEVPEVLEQQRLYLKGKANMAVLQRLDQYAALARRLRPEQRLPLVDLAIPALKSLRREEYQLFKENLAALAAADQKISLFEWALQSVVLHHLKPKFEGVQGWRGPRESTAREARQILFTAVAHYGVEEQYRAGALQEICGIESAKWTGDWAELSHALAVLDRLEPLKKQELQKQLIDVVLFDKQVPVEARELLRAVSELIGCPLPPSAL